MNTKNRLSRLFAGTLTALVLALFGSAAYAACSFPVPMQVPNGEYATEEEMVATQARVKEFMATAEAYLACLDEEIAALTEEPSEEQLRIRDMRHNAAVDEMEKLAAEFNAQVRVFKKRQ